jgi:amino acid permease
MITGIFILFLKTWIFLRNKLSLKIVNPSVVIIIASVSTLIFAHDPYRTTFMLAFQSSATSSMRSVNRPPPPLEQTSTLMLGSILKAT